MSVQFFSSLTRQRTVGSWLAEDAGALKSNGTLRPISNTRGWANHPSFAIGGTASSFANASKVARKAAVW